MKSLRELLNMRKRAILLEDMDILEHINSLISKKEYEILNEDTSSTGGPVSGGMGAVVSAQPSGLAGQTIGMNWASGGGTEGSGDISVPYNPSGSNRVFQKIGVMGMNHGSMTGKKSRNKKLNIKSLRDVIKNKKSGGKKNIMNFNDFSTDDQFKVKKIKEV